MIFTNTQNDLQEAIDRFPIISWLQQHFRVRDSGRDQLRIDCPVCKGLRTLSVNRDTKQFHCFRCDDGGMGGTVWNGRAGLFGFLMIVERISAKAAAHRIRAMAGLPDAPRQLYVQVPSASTWPREALPLSAAPLTHPSVRMLADRGVGHLIPHAKLCVDGEFSDRVLIPCNFFGELTGFEAKTYVGASPKSLLRYFTSGRGHVYSSRHWDSTIDFCVVTESILDAETLGVNAIGLFGSVLRDEQLIDLLELRNRGVRKLIWFLDGDALKKQNNSIRRKTSLFFENFSILSPHGEDPNSLGRERCWNLLSQARPIADELDLLAA